MNLSFSQLPEYEQTVLRHITHQVFKSINPDYLFCYGSRVDTRYTRSCYVKAVKAARFERQYDLAIIVSEQDLRPDEKLLLLARKATACCDLTNITLHRRDAVAKLLQEGDFFFCRLFTHAIPLHDPRPAPVQLSIAQMMQGQQALSPAVQARALQLLASGRHLAGTAATVYEEGYTAKALCLLSQSVQASLRAMLLACMGWLPQGASLYTLLNQSFNFTMEAGAVFPRNTREEAGLFGLIARTPGNILEAMGVSEYMMQALLQRAGRMNEVAEEVVRDFEEHKHAHAQG